MSGGSAAGGPLIICSKSAWQPPIRREHALARLAAAGGHRVVFIEAPADVRALRAGGRAAWLTRLTGRAPVVEVLPGLGVLPRATIVPGHRGSFAQAADAALLARALRACAPDGGATVVATTPWQWPALARVRNVRRVFDCADDWSRLMPSRGAALRALHERISDQADAVIVDADALRATFPRRAVSVVSAGSGSDLLIDPLSAPPGKSTLVHAGTLSERFDAPLVAAVLERLPDFRLELYGQCRYRGQGERPGAELEGLLHSLGERVHWHGVLQGREFAAAMDAADVLVVPHRREGAVTGASMKFYDYAARGRPVVSTRWTDGVEDLGAPHLYLADTAEEFAAAVLEAVAESFDYELERRAWAERNTWEARWDSWEEAIFGP
jgi:glycosyltransferase involved in cell wall biosynthesis